jgi:hypothetical protein
VVFTAQERDALRDELVARARGDDRISETALTGPAALGPTDRWSDSDIFFDLAFAAQGPSGQESRAFTSCSEPPWSA